MAQSTIATANKRYFRRSRFLIFFVIGVIFCTTNTLSSVQAATEKEPKFRRIPLQYIAALGDPTANSGTGAESWGIWLLDPSPRGVKLGKYEQLKTTGGIAPAKWAFDNSEWWVDENGMLMEKPSFPVSPGKYIVTGDREVMAILTIHPKENGAQRWELSHEAALYDVTHLPCRSARYTPVNGETSCTPGKAIESKIEFPITPENSMPTFEGCYKLDYAVLFVIAVEIKD